MVLRIDDPGPAVGPRPARRRQVGAVTLLVIAASLAPAAAQRDASASPASRDYPSLRLPFQDRESLYSRLANEADVDHLLALGESLVADAASVHDQVWLRGRLASAYLTYGPLEKARRLIDESTELVGSQTFRWMPEAGAEGFRKHRALFFHHYARCELSLTLADRVGAAAECQHAARHALRTRELFRWGDRGLPWVTGYVVLAHSRLSSAYRLAGRPHQAQEPLAVAMRAAAEEPPMPVHRYLMFTAAARLMMDLGAPLQAEHWARSALSVWDAAAAPALASRRLIARGLLLEVLVAGERWPEAAAEFDAVDALAQGHRRAQAITRKILTRALVYSQTGRLAALEAMLRAESMKDQLRLGADHPRTALLKGLYGAASTESRDERTRTRGRSDLHEATQAVLAAHRRGDPALDDGVFRVAVRIVLERYLRSVHDPDGPRRSADEALAFQVGDLLSTSSVQAAIHDAAVRSAAGTAGLGDVVRREQELRGELRALHEIVTRTIDDGDNPARAPIIAATRARAAGLEVERIGLQNRIAAAFPDYAALVRPPLADFDEVARRLRDDEAFVSLLPTEQGVHVWVVTRGDRHHRFAPVPVRVLADRVQAIRRSVAFDHGPPPAFAADAAHALYRDLFAGLDERAGHRRHLIVAAGGMLGHVPFAALPTAPPFADRPTDWLVRRLAVSQVPGVGAWLAVKRLAEAPRAAQPLLGWGDPRFAPTAPPADATAAGRPRSRQAAAAASDLAKGHVPPPLRYADMPPLPETRDELFAIAAALKADPDRDLVLGASATRDSVLAAHRSGALATRRVVAFATHGLVAGDLPNLVQPALAMAATPDAEHDPLVALLTLDDVLGLKLNADWVVLTACNTAAADGRSEEAMSGLARGFFFAGARSVLATHWPVETESARQLSVATFAHHARHAEAGRAESLREAMLAVMAQPRYRHPAYWAGYVLVGDGGR